MEKVSSINVKERALKSSVMLDDIKRQRDALKKAVKEKHTLYSKSGNKTYILIEGKINVVL